MNGKKTILVVDDEEINLRLAGAMLAPMGHSIVFARDGEEALIRALRVPPDLIILDVMMPKIDGFELTRRLRADEATKSVPILVVTALDEPEHWGRAIEAGADNYLCKPLDRTSLTEMVSSVLEKPAFPETCCRACSRASLAVCHPVRIPDA